MTYLYLSKIENNYLIVNFTENYDFTDPLNKGGLICKLDLTGEEVLTRYGILYCKVADQVVELEILLAGCKSFRQEEINLAINKALSNFLKTIDPIEKATFDIELKEAESYINSKGNYSSNILKSLALANSLKIDEMVQAIILKAKNHQTTVIDFKCQRDHLISKLEYIDTLDDFKNFDVEIEREKYLKDLYPVDLHSCVKEGDTELLAAPSNKEITAVISAVLSKNNKNPTKHQSTKKRQDPMPACDTVSETK